MKKIISYGLAIVALGICVYSSNVYASDININTTGWASVGVNEVQFDSDLLTTENAYQQNGITLEENSPFVIFDNANNRYAPADYIDNNSHFIGYFGSASEDVIPHSDIRLKWANGAFLTGGAKLDVVMKITNVHILKVGSSVNENAPAALVADWTTEAGLTRLHHSSYRARVYYDVTIELYYAGTSNKVAKDAVFVFRDLDVSNSVATTCENSLFSEGIYLTAPILNNVVFVTGDTSVLACDSEFGKNTRFVGTIFAENEESSGVALRMNTANASYRWTGSSRETEVGFASPSAVETGLVGDYSDKGTITATDKKVLWRNSKTIVVRPDGGYHVEKLYVDGEEVEFMTNDDGAVEYVLQDVTHDRLVQAEIAVGAYVPPEKPAEKDETKNPDTEDLPALFGFGIGVLLAGSFAVFAAVSKRR